MAVDGERVRLPAGDEVVVRALRPEDRERLAAAFERLGERSRFQRFLTVKRSLTASELTYLTEVDHVDHEAIGAIDPATGAGLGVARYIRLPDRATVAEAAVAVVDDWQGRGLGRLLLDRLVARAEENGIERFRASLIATNQAVRQLLAGIGEVRVLRAGDGVMELDVELPVERRCLYVALRGAARKDASLA